jgi:hypothetical protein
MTKDKERVFSIELESREDLKNITLADNRSERVTIEGSLGELTRAHFEEDVILEVTGTKGVLRVDLGVDEIKEDEDDE